MNKRGLEVILGFVNENQSWYLPLKQFQAIGNGNHTHTQNLLVTLRAICILTITTTPETKQGPSSSNHTACLLPQIDLSLQVLRSHRLLNNKLNYYLTSFLFVCSLT